MSTVLARLVFLAILIGMAAILAWANQAGWIRHRDDQPLFSGCLGWIIATVLGVAAAVIAYAVTR
jgi:hypothetical protein